MNSYPKYLGKNHKESVLLFRSTPSHGLESVSAAAKKNQNPDPIIASASAAASASVTAGQEAGAAVAPAAKE